MPRGGARKGAGRPKGSGRYGEPTWAVHIPKRMTPHMPEIITEWIAKNPFKNPPKKEVGGKSAKRQG